MGAVNLTTVKRIIGQRVRRLTIDEAKDWLKKYDQHWTTHKSIVNPHVQALTGGFNSQSINSYVVRKVFDRSKAK